MRNIYFFLAISFSIYSCSTPEVREEVSPTEELNSTSQKVKSIELNIEQPLVKEGKVQESEDLLTVDPEIEDPDIIEVIKEDPTEIIIDFHEYEFLTTFLKKYVSSKGNVNYISIKSDL